MCKVIYIYNMFRKSPLLQALCLNLFFLLLCLGIGGVHSGSLDDFFMSAIVTGAYGGEFDPHILFVNGAFAYFLKPFYAVLPWVGWYYIFEMLAVFASFTAVEYFVLRQVKGKFGIAVAVLLLACLAPDYYLYPHFTKCAAIAAAAGILLFYWGYRERKIAWLATAVLFVAIGVVFRKEGFLLGVPFLAAVLLVGWVEQKRFCKWTLLALFACACSYYALQNFNQNLFNNNEYTYYRDYQWTRAVFGDGDFYNVMAARDELDERGMSSRDLDLLRSWIFYDTEAFSLDSLKSVESVVFRNSYQMNLARMPAALFLVVARSFFGTSAWCWVLLCVLMFFMAPKRAPWYAWGSLALICLCLGYLLSVNRVVSHVESGIWLYAIVCAIPMMKRETGNVESKLAKLPYLVLIVALGCFVMGVQNCRPSVPNDRLLFGKPEMSADWKGFMQHVEKSPKDVFLLYFGSYKYLSVVKTPAYLAAPPHDWANIIPLGYWNINLPGMKREMHERGVENPIRDILKDNVYVLEEGRVPDFENFYERHYGKQVVRDTVNRFGELMLVKYKVQEVEVADE